MHLRILPDRFSILKMDAGEVLPKWVRSNKTFLSITYTEDELSIVCHERIIPVDFSGEKEKGWCVIKVEGILDFSMSGIMTGLTIPLTEAQISIFTISTYNTDYILIKENSLENAINIWKSQGHEITD